MADPMEMAQRAAAFQQHADEQGYGRPRHRDQAEKLLRDSDRHWGDSCDVETALGSVRDALAALTHAVLALGEAGESRG